MLKTEKGSISQEKRKRLERKFKLESSNTGVDGIKEKIKAIKEGIKELKTEKVKKATGKVAKEVATNIVVETKEAKAQKEEKMYVIPLGGMEEVGKNSTVVQYRDEIIIIDSGVIFPDENLLGIDLVIPDFSFLENNKDKIKGLFVTHGHEDHIGSIPYLYQKIDKSVPMFGGKLTLALAKSKFENGFTKDIPKMKEVKGRTKIKVGKYFTVEFIKITHSITDAYSLLVTTPAGTVFHTGDFKIDLTPVDGEHKMLKAHQDTAMETGIPKNNIIIAQNGSKIEVTKSGAKIKGKVNAGCTLVDGLGVGDIGNIVLKDRQQLSQDGVVVIVFTLDKETGKIVAGPDIVTRGFVYSKESDDIIKEAIENIKEKIDDTSNYYSKDWGLLKNTTRDIAAKFFYNKTKRNPMILPIIMEV